MREKHSYDLKPGNILFDAEGGVKITDFGLSKIVSSETSADTVPGVELTSQGAGTYWYLPPECFNMDRANPPKITTKVDVWSTGVIFYQMLFGARPFGEGQSQESILQQETVLRAKTVAFPSRPLVSDPAKDFIRRCLTPSQDLRPDIETLCQDPYVRSAKKRGAAPSSSSSSSAAGAGSPDGAV
jgi:tousled-like kinase